MNCNFFINTDGAIGFIITFIIMKDTQCNVNEKNKNFPRIAEFYRSDSSARACSLGQTDTIDVISFDKYLLDNNILKVDRKIR